MDNIYEQYMDKVHVKFNSASLRRKLNHHDIKTLPKIVAVDFDGTLVEDEFPDIGERNHALFEKMMDYKRKGWKIILWTCRQGDVLNHAVAYCYSKGLIFDAVNENIKEVQELFGYDTRKIYANIYIDDKAVFPTQPDHWKKGW
jgi:hypothetical protein